MGVLKWLRRERVTITTRDNLEHPTQIQVHSESHLGTIRTDEYKRDLAEFQARRTPKRDPTTPTRKKNSITVSCTNCTTDPDNTFNYEQKSATKYKKKIKRSKSDQDSSVMPSIQFLFQNQVFMPGNIFSHADNLEPREKPIRERLRSPSPENDELFFKGNHWRNDLNTYVIPSCEEVDGVAAGDAASKSGDEELCEVMTELRQFDNWADEQLKGQSYCSSKSDDYKSDASVYGLPIVSSSDVDVTSAGEWSVGTWGSVAVQVKKLTGVTLRHVQKKTDVQINILRKCRHPNIILLMGLYPDIQNNIYLICERCIDTLYNLLHVEGTFLTVQTAVQYTYDISNALSYIRMYGYIHTEVSSHSIMVTNRDTAKLADLGSCVKVQEVEKMEKSFEEYSPQPCYVNIGECKRTSTECEPLLSNNSSESYLATNCVSKLYSIYLNSQRYQWHAPELFEPDDSGLVYPCSKSDVYSLALVLWECCNAKIPFASSTYKQLKQMYLLWKTGMQLTSDGTYPGCLLEVLQKGLKIERSERPELNGFTDQLKVVKHKLSSLEDVLVPVRLSQKRSGFSSVEWTSPRSPRWTPPNSTRTCSAHSIEGYFSKTESNALYESLINEPTLTPLNKSSNKNPEDYSIPLTRTHNPPKVQINEQTAKFSKSFTPKSYKPLQIKVPDVNLDFIKTLPKTGNEKSYKFDIKNYSLPATPIARNNKLRKNAWLSGDIVHSEEKQIKSAPETPHLGTLTSPSILRTPVTDGSSRNYHDFNGMDSFTNIRRNSMPSHFTPESELNRTWSYKSTTETPNTSKCIDDEEALAKVSVKPLVAIHERRIYEATKKSGRSMSLPSSIENSSQPSPLKPASHCLDTLQKSLPQLNAKHPSGMNKYFKNTLNVNCMNVTPPSRNGGLSEEYCAARDKIQKSLNLAAREHKVFERFKSQKDVNTSTTTIPPIQPNNLKVDRATDTTSIEEFIRGLIRKEFYQLIQETNQNQSQTHEDLFENGLNKILKALGEKCEKTTVKSFSTVKINGNNKPLVQINIGTGENSVQVLDKGVNVTVNDVRDKLNSSLDETPTPTDDISSNPLKRCQAFSAIQEARSTEDLYIDDELSTQMQENFGGKIKLIPLHGSIHEILCDRENDCCLIKVKQENGCDSVYFRCDSDTESRDAIDSKESGTVVYKRSISLIEERIRRIFPKENTQMLFTKRRYAFETTPSLTEQTRRRSASTPCLNSVKEVEFNIDKLVSYTDSSSDECMTAADDEFEMLEKKIEAQVKEQAAKKVGNPDSLSVIEEVESNLECSDAEDEGGIKVISNLEIDTVDSSCCGICGSSEEII